MFTACFNALKKNSSLSAATLEELSHYCTRRTYEKESLILQNREICKHLYYIEQGLIRIFYYKKNKEITEWFAPSDNFCFSIISYFDELPSNLIIECLEKSKITLITKKGLDKLTKENLEISNLLISLFSDSLKTSQKRLYNLHFHTARQRYEKLFVDQPEIIKKAPQRYIASYLGISAETLSRIRNKG